jgi:hypothetical protein
LWSSADLPAPGHLRGRGSVCSCRAAQRSAASGSC